VQVAEGSPAAESGLQRGDKLLKFGTVDHSNHRQLSAIVSVVRDSVNKEVSVWVKRDQQEPLQLKLVPHVWDGQGLLGCHLLPLES
jgi:26S proteasome regulatory subunit N4